MFYILYFGILNENVFQIILHSLMSLQFTMPEWSHLKEPNPYYPSCTSALTIKYDPAFGRHVVANRDIEVSSFSK